MAEIFRGKATAGGGFEKPVAIKRILPHLSKDVRFIELLITEARTLSQLRHRNVVQIFDVGLGDDGQYFLVMEFVDGEPLSAQLARDGRIPAPRSSSPPWRASASPWAVRSTSTQPVKRFF
jgi:serine/threonine-protein kinase